MRHWPPLVIILCAILLSAMIFVPTMAVEATPRRVLAAILVGTIAWALWRLSRQEREASLRLEQLRGWANLVAGQRTSELRSGRHEEIPVAEDVQLAILEMLGRHLEQQDVLLRRFEAMLDTIQEGVVVVNAEGLISLVNAPGRGLFADLGPPIGKSVFEVLSRHSLQSSIELAQRAGKPIMATLHTVHGEAIQATVATLGEDGGAILRYPASVAEKAGGVEHDLTLHDRPPAKVELMPNHPLHSLPILSLDTETTGLDSSSDRILSVGAVQMIGSRIYRSATLNMLVNPGRPIPARSIAVHGISNAMVGSAPKFRAIAADIAAATEGFVLIGHHIDFDCAMIQTEMRRVGRDWSPAFTLDVMLIYAGLFPEAQDLSLDGMAAALDVRVIGRHSALGDALTTAELFARLLPGLREKGIADLSQARAFSAKAAELLADRKKKAGAGSQ